MKIPLLIIIIIITMQTNSVCSKIAAAQTISELWLGIVIMILMITINVITIFAKIDTH